VLGGKKKYIDMFGSFTEPFKCVPLIMGLAMPTAGKIFSPKCHLTRFYFQGSLYKQFNSFSGFSGPKTPNSSFFAGFN